MTKVVKDVFGTQIIEGDRIVKHQFSGYGNKILWLFVVGFEETDDGYPVMLTRKISGFYRPRAYQNPKGVKQPGKRNQHYIANKSARDKLCDKSKYTPKISKVVARHTWHSGYIIDHEWREKHGRFTNTGGPSALS